MATLGIDFGVSKVKMSDRDVKVNIFDMGGQPFFLEVLVYNHVSHCIYMYAYVYEQTRCTHISVGHLVAVLILALP